MSREPSRRLVRAAIALGEAFPGYGAPKLLLAARKVVEAMRYVDGEDESDLIEVSNAHRVEAVTLIEAWDAMIDAALTDRPRPALTPDHEKLRRMLEVMTGGPVEFVTVDSADLTGDGVSEVDWGKPVGGEAW